MNNCLVNPVAEKDKVEAGRDAGQDDEAQGEVGAQLRHPDGVEGVLQLHAPLTHVKDEEAEAAEQNHGQVLPVGRETVGLTHAWKSTSQLINLSIHSA